MRRYAGETLLIATHNPGKSREISALLSPYISKTVNAADLNLPEPEETGTTFADNAALKARLAAQGAGMLALADDSGLSVEALGGAPGIYSARWAGPGKDFAPAMARINTELGTNENRRARFTCVLAIGWPDGYIQTYAGHCEGTITYPPRGDFGFGYDPIFIPDGHSQTFAQMPPALKEAMSHRARAFAALVRDFF